MPDATVTPITANDWGTATSEYARDEFYTGSRSADGQSVTISLTVPSHMAAQVAHMIQSGKLPYKTREDFFRDAAHHRLHDLDEMGALDQDVVRRMAVWRRQEELDRQQAELEATEALIRETGAMVEQARAKQDLVLLETVVRQAEAAAADLHEPWRGRLLEKVAGVREVEG